MCLGTNSGSFRRMVRWMLLVITALAAHSVYAAPSVSAGGDHTCAVHSNGGVECWGLNFRGQLGDGSLTSSALPVAVHDINSAVSVVAGYHHSCAVLVSGVVQCWGYNNTEQQGDDNTASRSSLPVTVSGLGEVTAMATGELHSCALLAIGEVQCWGENSSGQLGNGGGYSGLRPVKVSGISNAVAITAGNGHSCAVLRSGSVQCWGKASATPSP